MVCKYHTGTILGIIPVLDPNGKYVPMVALFGASLIAAIFFGRVYCGYACPMNTVMTPIEWLSTRMHLQTSSTPNWLKKGILPWVALGISVIVIILSKRILHIIYQFCSFGLLFLYW